jgi:hypothetical protein
MEKGRLLHLRCLSKKGTKKNFKAKWQVILFYGKN